MFTALLPALLGAVGTVIDRLIPDKAAAEKAKQELEASLVKTANEVQLAQIEVNKQEAASEHLFVAGWRPFIGWVCGFSLFYYYMGYDWLCWLLVLFHSANVQPPRPDPDMLIELTLALLGMGGLRTFEKMRGVARNK